MSARVRKASDRLVVITVAVTMMTTPFSSPAQAQSYAAVSSAGHSSCHRNLYCVTMTGGVLAFPDNMQVPSTMHCTAEAPGALRVDVRCWNETGLDISGPVASQRSIAVAATTFRPGVVVSEAHANICVKAVASWQLPTLDWIEWGYTNCYPGFLVGQPG